MTKVSNFFTRKKGHEEKHDKKHAKHEKKCEIITDNDLLMQLSTLSNDFEQKVNEESEPEKKNCCVSLFSCMKSTSAMIPEEYKSIANWLTDLAIKQAKIEYNEEVLISALSLSLIYASNDLLGNAIPANVLIGLVEGIAKQFNLKLDGEANYALLQEYCNEHAILIPGVITTLMGEAATDTQLAKVG